MQLTPIGPKIESQPLNDNFAALNSAKLEKSGDTMTGLLTALGGIDLEVSSVPTGKVGRMHANGATKRVYYHDGTDWREVWHGGNNRMTIISPGVGYHIFANGFILQWGNVTIAANSNETVIFPISFPNELVLCLPVIDVTGEAPGGTVNMFNPTRSSVEIAHRGSSGTRVIRWMVLGR
jgi:hypothetical protein